MSQSLRFLGRAVREALAHPPGDGAPPTSIDLSGLVQDPPRMATCEVVEDRVLSARAVPGDPEPGFTGFLDGVQRSHVADYAGPVPIVAGWVAAVIRIRVDRRMVTWSDGHRQEARLYAPTRMLPPSTRADLEAAGLELRDTLADNDETAGHPFELLQRAVNGVKRDRDRLEQELAEQWVATGDGVLFVDGGLPPGRGASGADTCVGVIKNHHTIYAPGEALPVVLALRVGERSSVFLVERSWSPPVLSWYLRLRESPSVDPFIGLVRVEIARTDLALASTTARADEVSRWVLAERAPLALPDARWDRMVYGIRDCEEYLRAAAG